MFLSLHNQEAKWSVRRYRSKDTPDPLQLFERAAAVTIHGRTGHFSDNRPLFDDITVPSLVHNDLWDPNVLVSRGHDGELHIAALIDASNRMMQTGASKMACSN